MSENDQDWLQAEFAALHKRIDDKFSEQDKGIDGKFERIDDKFSAQDKRIGYNAGVLHNRIDDKAQAHENSKNAHWKRLEQRITDAANTTNRTIIIFGVGLAALALFLRYFG